MKKRMVLALGGNALGGSLAEQQAAVEGTVKAIAGLIAEGSDLVIVHGNGPQVGNISLAFEAASKAEPSVEPMPLDVSVAMSQGWIGFDIQRCLCGELRRRGINKSVATVITQVVVDGNDTSFKEPTKPIGPSYTESEAAAIARRRPGVIMREDSGRGFRQVVASPKPVDVVEKDVIASLMAGGHVVIACGGGGIPVVRKNGGLEAAPAVIDKDFAGGKLAEIIDADLLVILTAVEKVAINFGKPDQRWISEMTAGEADGYIAQGHFAKGSMLPKVQAAAQFVRSKQGRSVLITSLERALDGLAGKTGTKIIDG
ncbi:MAG: carbamate kinase [Clostridiales bacterium]|jgi:carbamate kinase|nr:carbamate kinase [Clostridiales bacterium]